VTDVSPEAKFRVQYD